MNDKPKVTPKDFFLWAGAIITLYASVAAFISLIFTYLNYAMPDALRYYSSDPYQAGASYEMATLLVLFPIFLAISHLIIRDVARDSSRGEVWVRRWAIYLTLFVAGALIAGDLITLIMYFFNGDVTLRFILKVLVILLVAKGVFLHYLADLKGYWGAHPAKARLVRWASVVLVVVTIAAGFFIIGTPWQARLYRFDEQKANNLQEIQYQVVNYWQTHQKLPATLTDLNDSISGYSALNDPQTGQAYEYSTKGPLAFELCATFNAPSRPGTTSGYGRTTPVPMPAYENGKPMQDSWGHEAGRTCFSRTIDPARYPPLTKQAP